MTYLQPVLTLLLLALAVGIRARSRRILVTATALLFLWTWPPFSTLAIGTLEWWYPIRALPAGDAEAIVVLSGGVYDRNRSMPEDLPRSDTYYRTSYASWLYRNWRPLPIVVSGGSTGHKQPPVVLADVMRRVLVEQGVPPAMIWPEAQSHSTYENALYSARLLRSRGIRRIALVTEAHHMLRSEMAFRRQGLDVTPAPMAYRYIEFSGQAEQFVPNYTAVETNELALHEWLGLLWYRLSGKI
jgi:uncharacterized SAM-binding protein YcdF (DUF218 family)